MPPTVVTVNSTAWFRVESSSKDFDLTLVYPKDVDASGGTISILAPVGSALLGLSVGDEMKWPKPDGGMLRVRIEEVTYQPKRSGEYRRYNDHGARATLQTMSRRRRRRFPFPGSSPRGIRRTGQRLSWPRMGEARRAHQQVGSGAIPRVVLEAIDERPQVQPPQRLHRNLPAPIGAEAADPRAFIGLQDGLQAGRADGLGKLNLVRHGRSSSGLDTGQIPRPAPSRRSAPARGLFLELRRSASGIDTCDS